MRHSPKLAGLNLSSNHLGDVNHAAYLVGDKQERMRARERAPSVDDAVAAVARLFTEVRAKRSLTFLDLSSNQLRTPVVDLLVELVTESHVTTLNLSRNGLRAQGELPNAPTLAPPPSPPPLPARARHTKHSSTRAAETLTPGVVAWRHERPWYRAESRCNRRVAGAKALARALPSSSLTSLDLSYNFIGAVGGIALAEALKGDAKLFSLSLDGNHLCKTEMTPAGVFTLEAIEALVEAVEASSTLGALDLRVNDLSDDLRQRIMSAQRSSARPVTITVY